MEAPKIPKLFGIRTKKPNQFHYEPRYYDERKEKMQKRYAQISKELSWKEPNENDRVTDFKTTLKENWESGAYRKKRINAFNYRVLVYVALLFALAYFLLK